MNLLNKSHQLLRIGKRDTIDAAVEEFLWPSEWCFNVVCMLPITFFIGVI